MREFRFGIRRSYDIISIITKIKTEITEVVLKKTSLIQFIEELSFNNDTVICCINI
ncbi:unnamed protein product [Brugia timori]|uniref:Uncharacterized protein n=1 Tax=Brugia timori TaxID=42155 RepID=A0A0R3QIR1_9BILA|nr:unnamed protein product [Brugia timori]